MQAARLPAGTSIAPAFTTPSNASRQEHLSNSASPEPLPFTEPRQTPQVRSAGSISIPPVSSKVWCDLPQARSPASKRLGQAPGSARARKRSALTTAERLLDPISTRQVFTGDTCELRNAFG